MKYKDRIGVEELCKWAKVAKSSFYYTSHPGSQGIKPSTHTSIGSCALVDNNLVVGQMRAILSMDYCIYGYQKMTHELRSLELLLLVAILFSLVKQSRNFFIQ